MELLLDTLKWSVITGAAALGLHLLRPILEKHYRARWRYWLWLTLAVLALLAPVQWEKLVPAAPAIHTPVVIDVPEMELQVTQGERVSVAVRPVTGLPPVTEPSATARSWQIAEILPTVWLGGAGVFALYTLAGAWLFRHRAMRWSRLPETETVQFFGAVRQDMGLKQAPPLRISSAVGSPMLLGVLRPCLLLPGEDWDELELAFILRHELTHYRRHDLWYKLVLLAANALHWFNPLMYLLVREAGVDLELTCDDAVVAGLDRDARRAYSETLLSAVRRGKGPALSTHFYGGKEVMKERFRNILGKQGRRWGALVLIFTLLATVATACAFGLRQAGQAETDTDEPVQGDGRYTSEGLSMTLPAESDGLFLVNPDGHPGYDYENELFTVFHKDTYLNEDPSRYDGRVMEITRYTEEEFFSGYHLIIPEYGYPFATDSEGRIYCITRRHDVTVPPEADELVNGFTTDEVFRSITDDFTAYNQLQPFDPVVEPLTAEELTAFEDYFNTNPLHNGMLRFPYNSFDDIKPYFQILFYDAGELVTDAAEYRAVSELYGGSLETDCVKLSTEYILAALDECFAPNVTVGRAWFDRELKPDMPSLWGEYLQEYDAYYTQHGDTNMVNYTFTKGEWNYDDSVTLYYTADIYVRNGGELDIEWSQPMQVHLHPAGPRWVALENRRA